MFALYCLIINPNDVKNSVKDNKVVKVNALLSSEMSKNLIDIKSEISVTLDNYIEVNEQKLENQTTPLNPDNVKNIIGS